MSLEFRGLHAEFLADTTPEIDLEGALSSGKTIVALWKELEALKAHPGIWTLITRWTEHGVNKLLRPEFERVARIHGSEPVWSSREACYHFPNNSRCYLFHLHTTEIEPTKRFGKIRGLPVSRIYVDQPEEVEPDFPVELRRRLRPDIEARVRGEVFPTQLTFTPNPTKRWHWLCKQFPDDNSIPTRRYYALSLMDNAHNLPEELIRQALIDCPKDDPRFRELILGLREEAYDPTKGVRIPFPENSAGALFEQAVLEAQRMNRA